MAFFTSAVGLMQTCLSTIGAGLGVWGIVNLLEGYGNDNPGANTHSHNSCLPPFFSTPFRFIINQIIASGVSTFFIPNQSLVRRRNLQPK